MRPIEDDAVEWSSDQVGDAEGGQAHPVEPLLTTLAMQVVPHRRKDHTVLYPTHQKEAGHDEPSAPLFSPLKGRHGIVSDLDVVRALDPS